MDVIHIIVTIICAIVVSKGLIEGADSGLEAIVVGVCFYILYNIILRGAMNA